MTFEPGPTDSRAAALRRSFDGAFSRPVGGRIEETEGFLAVGLGGHPYAIRLNEIVEVFKGRRVVRMPSQDRDFLGLSGLRRGITAVYSLGSLMGYGPSQEAAPWLLLAARAHSVAFAFDQFEGHLRISRSEIFPSSTGEALQHVSEVLRVQEATRPIINLRSVREALGKRET